MSSAGASAAVVAAAAKRRREQQEEEEMTKYTEEEIKEGWEFKIVRSSTGAFRNSTTLQSLIKEESQAGWTMLEKFDDSRVRFRRPVSACAKDATLSGKIDPYRTAYGVSEGALAFLIIGVVLAVTAAIVVAAVILSSSVGP